MSRTNCINCGAAIDSTASQCPYCGTSYFDFTDIDATGRVSAIRLRLNGQIVMFKAVTTLCEATIRDDYVSMYADDHAILSVPQQELTVSLQFEAIRQANGEVCRIMKEEE